MLPELERHHDVLAPTLLGHAGGPPLEGVVSDALVADAVERAMDDAGFQTAHIAGNSLGGYFALQLAARGRAESVVALAPAGGWAAGDDSFRDTLAHFLTMQEQVRMAAPHAEALLASPEGRRLATRTPPRTSSTSRSSCSPHQMLGVLGCAVAPLVEYALREGYSLDAEKVTCPVRIVWGTEDKLLPWPSTAARYRNDWLPHADGSSSKASGTARSSTSRSRRRS